MSGWNLIIDVARCSDCNNCVLADKDEYVGNAFPGYTAAHALLGAPTLRLERHVRGSGHMVDAAYVLRLCNHCDEAPCVAAGRGAVKKRADGIVIVDPEAAKGRRDLVDACPYGAIVWNAEANLPQNWIFDAHLLDQGWKAPRCAHSCPTDAIRAVKVDDAEMRRLAEEKKLRVLRPELGTRPRVWYENLHRADSTFVGGSVVATVAGRTELVEGVAVVLLHGGRELARAKTDAFGDFKFDGLIETAGDYRIEASAPGLGSATRTAAAGTTVCLGEISLA